MRCCYISTLITNPTNDKRLISGLHFIVRNFNMRPRIAHSAHYRQAEDKEKLLKLFHILGFFGYC